MSEIFNGISVPCSCTTDGCRCGEEERILRYYISNGLSTPMTDIQRDWCVKEANWAGEGYFTEEELFLMDDVKLCRSVIEAWTMYANSQ